MYLDNFIVAHKQHPPILTRLTLYVVEEIFVRSNRLSSMILV